MMNRIMEGIICVIFGSIIGCLVGLILGIAIVIKGTTCNSDIALKLANTMNSSMLDCVTHKIITQEQVHDIETIFSKHIEANFKHIKASHGEICEEDK